MRLSDNAVLITGGGTGIGYGMAEAFLEAGSTVAICGRTAKRLLEARAKHPELHTRVCDVSKEEDRKGLVDWAAAQLPGLNVLVNNAGVQRDVDFTKGIDDFLAGENEIRVNLEAAIILCGLFVPLLSKNKGAAIVNVSSGMGFVPGPTNPYSWPRDLESWIRDVPVSTGPGAHAPGRVRPRHCPRAGLMGNLQPRTQCG
jgi:uncharacterized oxidoreductase